MYKHILTLIFIAIFIGCSAPKPEKLPTWYTSPPQDLKYFYATGSGVDQIKAKKNAISNLRTDINEKLNKAFLNKTTKLKINNDQDIKEILFQNELFANKLTMIGLKIEKTAIFKNEHLILIKLPRSLVFDYATKLSAKKFKNLKEKYENIKNETDIRKYAFFLNNISTYYTLACAVEAKKLVLNRYSDNKELFFLNEFSNEFLNLKQNISFYILSDFDSQIFIQALKNAIKSSGLDVDVQSKKDNSLKLFVTSKTINSQKYGFYKTKTLIKYRVYDKNKKEISFRQHTFEAKSRISHLDAKKQSAIYHKSKIDKLGIYNFIGFN